MVTTAPELAAIRKARAKFRRAQAARDAALADLMAAVVAADTAGVATRRELVDAAGVARQTVYDALADAGRRAAAR